jgi:peptide/nickel transport system permease protein
MIPLLLGITVISFLVIHLAPGAPTGLQTDLNPKITAEARARLEKIYGLDKPLHTQYLLWLKRLIVLDLGNSFSMDGRPVTDKIIERIPITILINALSMFLIILIAIPIGVISASYQDSFLTSLQRFSFLWDSQFQPSGSHCS